MRRIDSFLTNLQIIFQVLLWLLSFYWLDFELFTYILNDYTIFKYILGIIMTTCQLYLYQNIFYLSKIDSIFEKEDNSELQNINEKHDYTSCKKCNNLRPKRAHHCRYCNKCIIMMDHHCFTFNKCIGKNNYWYFIKYILFSELNATIIFWSAIYVCCNYYSELEKFSIIKYGIMIFTSFMASFGLFFYLLFHIYICLSDLTTLEYMYPNLRIK